MRVQLHSLTYGNPVVPEPIFKSMFFVLLVNGDACQQPTGRAGELLLDCPFHPNGVSILIPVPYCFVYKWLLITKEKPHNSLSEKELPFTWKHHWFGGLLCILGMLLLFQCCQHSPQIQLYWSLALLSTFKIILKSSKITSLFIIMHFTSCVFHLITKKSHN